MEDKEKQGKEVMKETVWSSCSQRDDRNKDLTEEPLNFFVKYLMYLCASFSFIKAFKEQKTLKHHPPQVPCLSPLP